MMKKAILIVLTLFATLPALPARAEAGPLTLLLAGSRENDSFFVSLTPDGREYKIISGATLEAGGDICSHPDEARNELVCNAPAISGFEVNTAGGEDYVAFSSDIPVPVTIRGGSGDDRLIGGGASDKILGGTGNDVLIGRRGDDWIEGGPGNDHLIGGQGNDRLVGGIGKDKLVGGPGQNTLIP
jgi:Ca2+-binding RTX toxin-like protein